MHHDRLRVVLLAGGGGERFWPKSRPQLPKQFLDLDGTGSLLQKTYRRALGLVDPERVYVATRKDYDTLVIQHLPELPTSNLILEPEGRDTAPGLALAALVLAQADPETIMVALPADHLVTDEACFLQSLRTAAGAAMEYEALVTLGIHPTRPETGYGYIRVGDVVGQCSGLSVHRALRFAEKPDLATARGYLENGEYLWNSGMFAWHVRVLREEIARHLPELDAVLTRLEGLEDPVALRAALPQLFPRAPRISIDYGVLERSDRVLVVPAYFGWDDVGTWAALDRVRPSDPDGNSVRGPAILHASSNVLVEGEGRVIAAVGVSDLVIVDTEDAVLVCHKNHAQSVRQVAAAAQQLGRGRAPYPPEPGAGRVVEKPWGREVWWAVTDQYVGKLIEVRAGHSLSLQYHEQKLETMYFQRGRGRLRVGDAWQDVGPGAVITLPPGTIHQLAAVTDMALIEVSTPHLDDVVRLADLYGRSHAEAVVPAEPIVREK